MKRKILICRLYLDAILRKGKKKEELIRKSGLFRFYGKGGYWHPRWIPSKPEMISIGNNVSVCADVRFYEHDVIEMMFNQDPSYVGPYIRSYKGEIVVGDNAVIGARSIILYNVKIGRNALVAAGSVVTKNVPDYAIVAGNPAKVIGSTKELLRKRLEYSGCDISEYNYDSNYKSGNLCDESIWMCVEEG